jgi:hypothetical protein
MVKLSPLRLAYLAMPNVLCIVLMLLRVCQNGFDRAACRHNLLSFRFAGILLFGLPAIFTIVRMDSCPTQRGSNSDPYIF